MSAADDRVLRLMKEKKQHWCEVGPGLRVQFRRPYLTELNSLEHMGATERAVEQVCRFVIGWEGFTEATMLGEAIGSSDPLPFTPELWAEFARDEVQVAVAVHAAIHKAISACVEDKAAAEKNS